jgi:ribosomal protein L18E
LNKALTVKADKFSSGAKEKIEKAGGQVIVNEPSGETDERRNFRIRPT